LVPAGRGPFRTFEEGALDALRLKGYQNIRDWSVARCLYEAERFNGFGYVSRGINSPYLWSYTDLYTRGKYVSDGVWSVRAVSSQCGVVPIMKAMGIELETKVLNMTDLKETVSHFVHIAPVLVTALESDKPDIAVRVLSEVLKTDKGDVATKLTALSLLEVVPIIRAAEDLIKSIVRPTVPVIPRAEPEPDDWSTLGDPPPAAPSPVNWLDRIIPAGYKTPLGIALYVAGSIAGLLNLLPPDIATSVTVAGGGLIGVGIKAAIDRWVAVFAGLRKVSSWR
jgi:hypothetical protein